MSATHSPERYTNIVHEAEIDGGWSGQLRIVVGTGISDESLVFVDSELLGPRRLVLTPAEAGEVGPALTKASIKAARSDSGDLAPRVAHRWDVDVDAADPDAPLTLWRDGNYVAHLDSVGAEGLAILLQARADAVTKPLSAAESTLK